MRTTCVSIALLLLLALGAAGQTSFYLGGGPSLYVQNGQRAGNLTVGLCSSSGATCNLTSIEARGSAKELQDLVYAMHTALRQEVAYTENGALKVSVGMLGQVGVAVAQEMASGLAGMGGDVTFQPKRWPGFSFSVAARGVYSPVNPG